MAESCDTLALALGNKNGESLSTQLLYKFFCNNLRLGQWELARACIEVLVQGDGGFAKVIGELLRNVLEQPLSYCDGSPSVPTAFHLSWLCLLELVKHYEGKIDLPESLKKKIEFRLLLQSCSSQDISLQCLQELDCYHSQVVLIDQGQVRRRIPSISSSWLKPLKNLVHKQPQIAHWIIQCLQESTSESVTSNTFFQNLYLDLIKEHLTTLDALETSLKGIDFENLGESDKTCLNIHKMCCDGIHQLLVALNPQLGITETEVDKLQMNLLHRVHNNPSEHLSKASIYSALLSHSSHILFQKFCHIENDWQLRLCLNSSADMLPSVKVFVPIETILTHLWGKDGSEAWKLLYFHARKNNHILEDVVKSCIDLVHQGDLHKVTKMLSYEEFSPMKVLVLLLAWPFCHSCDSAQKLLDILWDPSKPSKHQLLNQACARLEYQVHLVKWCLDKAKPLIAARESPPEDHEKAYEMFQSLDSHSVLHVLHQSSNLSQLPEDEVLEMLRTRPVFSDAPSLSEKEHAKCFDERAEVQRDVALYHGFYALRTFMEAILQSRRDEGDGVSDLVTKIQEAHDHVDNIFPITFRVEVLENVFSLLFLSSEHLTEELSQADESDELETLESRSLRSSRTASFESFVSIDSRNNSPWKPLRTAELMSEVSTSRTVSPEPLKNFNGENLPENFTTYREADRGSGKLLSEEQLGQKDFLNAEVSTVEERTKLGTRPVRARELQFDNIVVPAKSVGETDDVFRLPFERVGKDKLLDFNERKIKGLLVNKKLVGQLLEMLKKCLKEILRLKTDQHEISENKIHADWIQTSVSMTTLEQRISRLGQYINEAQWRYQLVSTCHPDNESDDEVSEDHINFSSDGDSDFEHELIGNVKSSDDVSKPWRRKTKLTKDRMLEKPLTCAPLQDTSIPRLLSSPSSLIYMCMKKDNYGQAKHIIKLFNVDDNESSKAVLFAEEYEKAFQKLTQLEKNKTKEKVVKTPPKKGRLSLLKSVASAAAAGVASVSPVSIVEELLLSASIELSSSGLTLTEPAHAHFVCALVSFDFLCTGQMTKRSCQSLLELAKQKMTLGTEIEPSTPYTLRRISEFLTNMDSLLSDDIECQGAIDSFLGDIKPLDARTVKNYQELQGQQNTAFTKLEEAIEDGDTIIKSVAENPTADMPALLKFRKMEQKTAVRVAMIEFHNAFDCERDGRLIVVRKSKRLSTYRLDYVQSLYNHANMLSTWELLWKMNSQEPTTVHLGSQKPISLKATNPFVVLTQGFDDLAGKPLFERNVPPKRMESMCKKMNVNLIRIIVHNCCPVIPAFGPSQRSSFPLSSSNRVVLNSPVCEEVTEIANPVDFAEMLLKKMKQLLEGMRDPDTGVVDRQSLVVLSSYPSYFVLVKEIRKLSLVDLNALTTDVQKICFFTNVLNILLTQSAITELSESSSAACSNSRRDIPHDCSQTNSSFWPSGCNLPRLDLSYCRAAYLRKYGYNIGQMGFISAFDLWFTALRNGLHAPAGVHHMSLSSQVSHNYQRYQPEKSDFRITFVISDGTISAPEMQVLNEESLDTQLNDAMSNYLTRNVSLNEDDEKVAVPELLKWYQKDFTTLTPAVSSESDAGRFGESESWVDLLLQISPYLLEEKFKNFDDVAPQLNVTFTPHCWQIGYSFLSANGSEQRHSTPSVGATHGADIITTEPKYTLTQTLSNYLTERSPLVASLANLSRAQDCGEECTEKRKSSDKEIPPLLSSLTNNGVHSLLVASPFQFAMNQAVKFPVLQRHIASSFYAVLKFLYLSGLGLTQPLSPKSSFFTNVCSRNYSRLFLFDESTTEVSDVYLRAVNYAWQKGDWELLLEVFDSVSLQEQGGLGDAEDFVLEMVFQKGVETNQDDDITAQTMSILREFNIPAPNFELNWKKNRWLLLYRIQDNDLRARLVLQCLHNWIDVDVCLKMLHFCLSKPPRDKKLLDSLAKKMKQMTLCKKIMQCHSTREFSATQMNYQTWKDVVDQSVRNPESVLQALLDHEQFELVREWMEIFGYSPDLRQKIHEEYLKHLFKRTPVDITEVYMYLEEINDPEKALIICERLLSSPMTIPSVVFVVHFIITDLDAVLKPDRKRELLRQKLGANALLCIPESHRRSYESLVSQPMLLLEQLLMDMKVDWAGKMFGELQIELSTNRMYDESLKKEISVEAFEKLLVIYASKALEFEVLSYQPQAGSQSQSSKNHRKASTPTKKHRRNASTGRVSSSLRSLKSSTFPSNPNYKIPEYVPGEDEWEPDYKHSVCMICQEATFNMFVRRHHCRRCGRVVCDACSPFKRILEQYGRTPVRVCKDCDKTMYEESFRREDFEPSLHTGSLPTYLTKSGDTPASAGLKDTGTTSVMKPEDEFNFGGLTGWKLTLNQECNEVIRQDFLYEQVKTELCKINRSRSLDIDKAPSSSLCTSILALHSDSKRCAKLLLELCNKLSQKVGSSEEIDNNLLISIICQLLLHAKLKFTNCGETQGVELCDTYMSLVELVKFLIESNYYEVPSIEDLMSSHTARRLRDRLIENESLNLAMEVTTKCGLDPGAVWGAWGLAYLQVGKFKEARQKFGKFLKPSDRGKPTQGNIRYLQMIIDILETSPMISFDYLTVGDLDASLGSLREHAKNPSGPQTLDPKRFDECIFYLNTYGSFDGVVSFYVKHNQLKLACRFTLEKRCSPEIFTESLLMPVIRSGQFDFLREVLQMFDPSLDVWLPYLNGACLQLSRANYLKVLYRVQILIKDFFRAAMTCIKFYQGLPHHPATSYSDLHSRTNYLQDAKGHLEAVRKYHHSKRGALAMVSSSLQMNMNDTSEDKTRMSVTPTELTNYMNAIILQMEVTKFMNNCYMEGTVRKPKAEGKRMGTLFDNANVKCDVVSEVLLAGSSVNDGFSLSCRIIQDFRLPAVTVYKTVSLKLAEQQKFNEVLVLLTNALQTRLINDKDHDGILIGVLGTLVGDDKKWKQAEVLIKLLKEEDKKVAVYIRFGRLRTAYLIAVASERVDDIKTIARIAQETEQVKVYNICVKWLHSYAKKHDWQDVFTPGDVE